MPEPRGVRRARPARAVVLATDEAVARRARAFVSEAMVALGRAALGEVAALLVSELVTNVARHTDVGSCTVSLDTAGAPRPVVTVEVVDRAADLPVTLPSPAGERAEGGRGLRIVAALADEWGVRQSGSEKSVWFRLAR